MLSKLFSLSQKETPVELGEPVKPQASPEVKKVATFQTKSITKILVDRIINKGEENPFLKLRKDLGLRPATPKHPNSLLQDFGETVNLLDAQMPNVSINDPPTQTLREIYDNLG